MEGFGISAHTLEIGVVYLKSSCVKNQSIKP